MWTSFKYGPRPEGYDSSCEFASQQDKTCCFSFLTKEIKSEGIKAELACSSAGFQLSERERESRDRNAEGTDGDEMRRRDNVTPSRDKNLNALLPDRCR